MERIDHVPKRIFWIFPLMAIDRKNKMFYFGIFKWAYILNYG